MYGKALLVVAKKKNTVRGKQFVSLAWRVRKTFSVLQSHHKKIKKERTFIGIGI